MVALGELQCAEICIQARALRRQLGRVLRNGDRVANLPKAGQCVAQEHERANILGIAIEHASRARLRVLEPATEQEKVAGLDLQLHALGQQVGRAHVFRQRVPHLVSGGIRLGKLVSRLAILGRHLDGPPVFENGFRVFLPGQILIARAGVLKLQLLGIADAGRPGGDSQQEEPEDGRPDGHAVAGAKTTPPHRGWCKQRKRRAIWGFPGPTSD